MSCNTFCGCNGTIRNTGVPNSQLKIEDGTGIIVVPLVADDGTENVIRRSDTLNQAYFQAKVTHPDPSKRWYPIGNFTNVTNERAESSFETFSDNSRSRTVKGLRTFTGWLLNYAPAFAAAIESLRCQKIGIFYYDDCGEPTGEFCMDMSDPQNDKFKPVPVNESSIDSLVILQSDAAAGKVQMQFDFSQLAQDKNLRKLTSEEMGGANLLELDGLIPTKTAISAESSTGFTAAITVDYDKWETDVVTGLVLADFALFNETQNTAVTITSVTEAPKGTYTFVIPSQASADELTLTQAEGTEKPFGIDTTITIP